MGKKKKSRCGKILVLPRHGTVCGLCFPSSPSLPRVAPPLFQCSLCCPRTPRRVHPSRGLSKCCFPLSERGDSVLMHPGRTGGLQTCVLYFQAFVLIPPSLGVHLRDKGGQISFTEFFKTLSFYFYINSSSLSCHICTS